MKRLEKRRCTVHNNVEYSTGESDEDCETNPTGKIFNRTRLYIEHADDMVILRLWLERLKEL
jgi:hypothetical protein